MEFEILFSEEAYDQFDKLKKNPSKEVVFKAVKKSLKFMKANLRHPSLNTHEFYNLYGPNKEKVFESYAQNKTPGAYRIFWYYGPEKGQITIASIVPHL